MGVIHEYMGNDENFIQGGQYSADSSGGYYAETDQASRYEQQLVCPVCGTTWSEYCRSMLVGCPDCYKAFSQKINREIRRVQHLDK